MKHNRKVPSDETLLAMMQSGMNGSEIARQLGLSPKCVNRYMIRSGLRDKFARPTKAAPRSRPDTITVRKTTYGITTNTVYHMDITLPRVSMHVKMLEARA